MAEEQKAIWIVEESYRFTKSGEVPTFTFYDAQRVKKRLGNSLDIIEMRDIHQTRLKKASLLILNTVEDFWKERDLQEIVKKVTEAKHEFKKVIVLFPVSSENSLAQEKKADILSLLSRIGKTIVFIEDLNALSTSYITKVIKASLKNS